MTYSRDRRDIIRRLRAEGWVLRSVRGSHHNFRHPNFRNIVTVPHPKRDIAVGTVANIAKLAGWRDNDDKEE